MLNAEQMAMDVWCEADLAVAGGNVTAHRARIAEVIRAAQREAIGLCMDVVSRQTTINIAEVTLLHRVQIEMSRLIDRIKKGGNNE